MRVIFASTEDTKPGSTSAANFKTSPSFPIIPSLRFKKAGLLSRLQIQLLLEGIRFVHRLDNR